MKRCPYCGKELEDDAVTCPGCSRSLATGIPSLTSEVPAGRTRRLPVLVAMLTVVVLVAGASVIWFFASRAAIPDTEFEPDVASVPPGSSEAQVFVGCVGQTGDADTFVLSVSRAKEPEPLPPGTPIPRKPTTRAGVPLTGGTPEQPPTAGTGEAPVGGTPLTRAATYVLVGSGGLRLTDHLGHTIEVTGVLDPRKQLEFPRLQVASARHIAAECGPP